MFWNKIKLPPENLVVFATLIWSLVGIMLLLKGWAWKGTGYGGLILAVGILLGIIKARTILDKKIESSLLRVNKFTEPRPFYNVFSGKTWILVAVMISLGKLLRSLAHPCPAIGILYVTVGSGLLLSSRKGWVMMFKK